MQRFNWYSDFSAYIFKHISFRILPTQIHSQFKDSSYFKCTCNYFLYYCLRTEIVSPGGKGFLIFKQLIIFDTLKIWASNGPWGKKSLCRFKFLVSDGDSVNHCPLGAKLIGDTGSLRSPIFLSVSHHTDFSE